MRSFRHLATAQHPRTRNPPNAVAARNNYSPTNLLFETVPRWTTQLRSSLLHCYTMGTAQALPAIHELTHFDRRDLKSPYKSEIPFDPNAGHVTLLYDFHNFLSSLYKVFPSTHLFFYIQKDIAYPVPATFFRIYRILGRCFVHSFNTSASKLMMVHDCLFSFLLWTIHVNFH